MLNLRRVYCISMPGSRVSAFTACAVHSCEQSFGGAVQQSDRSKHLLSDTTRKQPAVTQCELEVPSGCVAAEIGPTVAHLGSEAPHPHCTKRERGAWLPIDRHYRTDDPQRDMRTIHAESPLLQGLREFRVRLWILDTAQCGLVPAAPNRSLVVRQTSTSMEHHNNEASSLDLWGRSD
ncbi:hypothetical protein L1887_53941 [Cichorium endivia]|nr:hypothetical protein L1887_53941 [Cichorium endivia]